MSQRQRLGTLVAVLGLLAVAGCADEQDPAPDPPPSTATPTDDASSPTGTPTSQDTAAATGAAMELDNASIRAPEGWSTKDQGGGLLSARHPRAYGSLYFSDFGTVATNSLREFVRITGLNQFQVRPEVDFRSELGGEDAYHAFAHERPFFVDEYGAILGDQAVTLTFQLDERLPAKQRTRVVESVLASFSWS